MTDLHWTATARDGTFTFDIRRHDTHGTYVLRIADTQTNRTIQRFNTFASAAEAEAFAATWQAAHEPKGPTHE